MSMKTVEEIYIMYGIIASIIGTVMASTPLLQIIKLIRTKQSRDVSIPWPTVLGLGNVVWIGYGIVLHNPPLIITNTWSALTNLTTALLAFYYRETNR